MFSYLGYFKQRANNCFGNIEVVMSRTCRHLQYKSMTAVLAVVFASMVAAVG